MGSAWLTGKGVSFNRRWGEIGWAYLGGGCYWKKLGVPPEIAQARSPP
jgi:hypothetical protein